MTTFRTSMIPWMALTLVTLVSFTRSVSVRQEHLLSSGRLATIDVHRSSFNTTSMSADILQYVNEHRRSIGLAPLQANSFISSVALGHSKDMLSGRTRFGHDGFRDRVNTISKHLGTVHLAGENVASGPMSAREVVNGWLHSPGHRRNIEGDFRMTGIGLARRGDGVIYFTQIFTR